MCKAEIKVRKCPINPALYLYIEILKCSRVPPQQVCRVLGKEADTEQTLHPLEVCSVHHLSEHRSVTQVSGSLNSVIILSEFVKMHLNKQPNNSRTKGSRAIF